MDKIKLDGFELSEDIEELQRVLSEDLTKRYDSEKVKIFLNHLVELCQMRKNIPNNKNRLYYRDKIQDMLDTFKKTKRYLNHLVSGKPWLPFPERIWDYDNKQGRQLAVLELNALEKASQVRTEPIEALIAWLFELIFHEKPTSYEKDPFTNVVITALEIAGIPKRKDPSRAIKDALKHKAY